MSAGEAAGGVTAITAERLRRMKLPAPDEDGDKEERGRVLVVAGAVELPGAAVLAGTAALRAGAGKLRIATCASVAPAIGVAVPEALAQRLPETDTGNIDPAAAAQVARSSEASQTLLIGPGLVDEAATIGLTEAVLDRLHSPSVVLDAGSLAALARNPRLLCRLEGQAVITPHAGEMAKLMDMAKDEVRQSALETARRAADRFRAIVMLKGAETFVVAPDGRAFRYADGCVGWRRPARATSWPASSPASWREVPPLPRRRAGAPSCTARPATGCAGVMASSASSRASCSTRSRG